MRACVHACMCVHVHVSVYFHTQIHALINREGVCVRVYQNSIHMYVCVCVCVCVVASSILHLVTDIIFDV